MFINLERSKKKKSGSKSAAANNGARCSLAGELENETLAFVWDQDDLCSTPSQLEYQVNYIVEQILKIFKLDLSVDELDHSNVRSFIFCNKIT
jgi:hypothetical protein